MLNAELLDLIQQGESNTLEFKRDDLRPEKMAKEITSFANGAGGAILIGVEDDGSISGVQRANLQEWIYDTVIGRYMSPPISPEYKEVVTPQGKVAVVTVPQGVAKPYVVKNHDQVETYVRYGNTTRPATREQLVRLFQSGGLLHTEKSPVHGSSLADLDERRLREYFYDFLKFEPTTELAYLLQDHDFLLADSNYCCSYFAHAMFAKAPQIRLPHAGVRFTVYDGVDKDYNSQFDESLNIPLLEYRGQGRDSNRPLEDALHNDVRFQSHISKDVLIEMTRRRIWDYPQEAVRELLINALVHRDWTKLDMVRVVAYSDRLEVISPGALPNGMTVKSIKNGVTNHRNPRMARIFNTYGYMEQQGMGIRRTVIPLMLKHNGVEPIFEATEDYFKVVLRKKANGNNQV